jgi:hypothetical protein
MSEYGVNSGMKPFIENSMIIEQIAETILYTAALPVSDPDLR